MTNARERTELELAMSRRDQAFLTGNLAALAAAQDALNAIWGQLEEGTHTLVIDPEDVEIEHHGCPTIESNSLNGYHNHIDYVCLLQHVAYEQGGLSEFLNIDPGTPFEEQTLLVPGRYAIEVDTEGTGENTVHYLVLKENA